MCLPPSGIGSGPLAPWIFWALWTTRNKLLFEKTQPVVADVVVLSSVRAREWQEAQKPTHPKPKIAKPVKPTLSLLNSVKVFTDASWKADGSAGLGWIFKDHNNHVIAEGSTALQHVGSPLLAEASATLSAVRVAMESDSSNFFFASDSITLVKALNLDLLHKDLHGILHDILALSSHFDVCSLISFLELSIVRLMHWPKRLFIL